MKPAFSKLRKLSLIMRLLIALVILMFPWGLMTLYQKLMSHIGIWCYACLS